MSNIIRNVANLLHSRRVAYLEQRLRHWQEVAETAELAAASALLAQQAAEERYREALAEAQRLREMAASVKQRVELLVEMREAGGLTAKHHHGPPDGSQAAMAAGQCEECGSYGEHLRACPRIGVDDVQVAMGPEAVDEVLTESVVERGPEPASPLEATAGVCPCPHCLGCTHPSRIDCVNREHEPIPTEIARTIIGRVLAATSSREEQYARILGELAAHVGERWPQLPDPAILAGNTALIREALPALVDTWERRFRAAGADNIDVTGLSAPQTSGPTLGTRWAQEQVARVQEAAQCDDGAAHDAEDEALWEFVWAVAECRVAHPRLVAEELMAMGDIDFERA